MAHDVISRKVAHQALNRLQVILGQLEVCLVDPEFGVARGQLEKTKKEVLELSKFIRESTAK